MCFLQFIMNLNVSSYNAHPDFCPVWSCACWWKYFWICCHQMWKSCLRSLFLLHGGMSVISSSLPVFVKRLLGGLLKDMTLISNSLWSHRHHSPSSVNLLNAIRSSHTIVLLKQLEIDQKQGWRMWAVSLVSPWNLEDYQNKFWWSQTARTREFSLGACTPCWDLGEDRLSVKTDWCYMCDSFRGIAGTVLGDVVNARLSSEILASKTSAAQAASLEPPVSRTGYFKLS